MALSRKGIRKIIIDEMPFEWTIRKQETNGMLYHEKRLRAAIQLDTDTDRGVLMVDFGVTPPGNWRAPHKTSVTPKTIEEVIRAALKEGWNPLTKTTYKMSYSIPFVPSPEINYV